MPFKKNLSTLLAVAALCCAWSTQSFATPITLGPGLNTLLTVLFTAPVQNATHNAIQFDPSSSSGSGTLTYQASLYDESGLLGTYITTNFFGRFTDPSSFFSGGAGSTNIDFSRIADGVVSGRFEFLVIGGTAGSHVDFDSANFVGRTFGDSGGFPSSQPVVTSVTASIATSVPEPGTFALLGLGLAGLGIIRRKTFKRNLGTLLAAAAAMLIGVSPAVALPVSGQGTWETTLQARDLNGDSVTDAYYDTALNVTWLGNANANGGMNWFDANTWAGDLVVGTTDDWSLPTIDALYNLFHVTLGNTAPPYPALTNTGNFLNMQTGIYWSGTEDIYHASYVWTFYTYYDGRTTDNKYWNAYAMAVRPGDVAATVPEPASLLLMLAGLCALVVLRRRQPFVASAR